MYMPRTCAAPLKPLAYETSAAVAAAAHPSGAATAAPPQGAAQQLRPPELRVLAGRQGLCRVLTQHILQQLCSH